MKEWGIEVRVTYHESDDSKSRSWDSVRWYEKYFLLSGHLVNIVGSSSFYCVLNTHQILLRPRRLDENNSWYLLKLNYLSHILNSEFTDIISFETHYN